MTGRTEGTEAGDGMGLLLSLLRRAHGSGRRLGLGRVVIALASRQRRLRELNVPMDDGRILVLDLTEPQNLPYLFYGRAPYELGEERVVKSLVRPGEQVVDVGANVGWYSTMLANLVRPGGRVYAFEPNQDLMRNLRLTASAYPALRVMGVAVGDAEGEATLRISRLLGNSSVVGEVPEQTGSQVCHVVTLDRFLASVGNPQITFVKSDTEGAELRVLNGANRLLNAARPPACLVEMNRRYGLEPSTVVGFFQKLGRGRYSAWRIDSVAGSLQPPEFGPGVCNALFVPEWLMHRVAGLVARQKHHPAGSQGASA